jgi:tetratricopeptide (TPR) repeat protein
MRSPSLKIIGLCVALLVLAYLFGRERAPSAKTSHSLKVADGRRPIVEKVHVPAVRTPASEQILLSAESLESDADRRCYKQIKQQMETNRYIDAIQPQLNEVVGKWYIDSSITDAAETSASGKFLEGLARSGFLEGRTLERDDKRALKLLRQAAAGDPQNSAPWLYMAMISERSGNAENAHKYFLRAFASGKFDSYVKTFARAVFRDVRTPTDWMEAVGVWSNAPMVDYNALSKFLRSRDSELFAVQMVATLPENPSSVLDMDIDWIPVEYMIAKNLLDKFSPGNKYPSARDLMKIGAREGPGTDFLELPSKYDCNLSVLQPLVDHIRAKLNP